MIEELEFERAGDEDGPGRPRGGPKPDTETKLEVKNWPERPTWRPKSDPGSPLGGPKLTLEASLEAQAGNETNLERPGPPRTPT